MKTLALPTQKELQETFFYDPFEGTLHWKIKTRKSTILGSMAGTRVKNGYLCAGLNGHRYLVHRLIWKYHTGQDPVEHIDHINGDPTDNRIENLRDVSNKENSQNRRHSKGYYQRPSGRFSASICVDGKSIHLGMYDCEMDAHDAYLEAKENYHPIY